VHGKYLWRWHSTNSIAWRWGQTISWRAHRHKSGRISPQGILCRWRRKAEDCGMSSSLSSSRGGGSSSPLSLPLWLPLVSPASSCRTCGVSSPARAYSSGHRAARPPPAAAQCLRSAEPVRPANTGGSPTSSLAIARPNATAVASEMRKSCCRLGALSRLCASCSDLMLEELRVVRRCP
jgi:hypothetical protein